MTAKSLDLVIGADVSASISKLQASLDKEIIPKLSFNITNVTLDKTVITSLQSQIQEALNSKTYTIKLNTSETDSKGGKGGSGRSGKVSSKLLETVKDADNLLKTKNYLRDLNAMHLPEAEVKNFTALLANARIEADKLFEKNGRDFGKFNTKDAEKYISVWKEVERSFESIANRQNTEDPISESSIRKLENYKLSLKDASYYVTQMKKNAVDGSVISDMEAKYTNLQEKLRNFDFSKATESEARELLSELAQVQSEIRRVNEQTVKPKFDQSFATAVSKASQRISELLNKYPHLEEQNNAAYQRLIQMREQLSSGNLDRGELQRLTTEFSQLKAEIDASGLSVQTVGDKIKKMFFSQLGNMAISSAVGALKRSFKELYNSVVEIDKAMIELKKVTDLSADAYDSFLRRASSAAVSVGATVSDYVDATADFARLGFSLADSENLATTATIYKNVGDGIESIADASESVISTMKAFNIEAKDSIDIIDAFNEVGNNYAISSTGIGIALGNSASALAAANNTLAESIGLVVAANDVVQDPAKVGTALKTISMFLRASKSEAEEAGIATDEMAESVSKLRSEILALTGNKVDIMIDDSTYKSTYQILEDLSKVWDQLTDVNQATILERISGKRGANVAASLINNFKDAQAVLKTIEQDEGSALKEQEKFLEGIEGRQAQLKAMAQTFAQDFLGNGIIKGVTSFLTKILEFFDKITRSGPGLISTVSVLVTLVGVLFSKATGSGIAKIFGKVGGGLPAFIQGFKELAKIKQSGDSITAMLTAVNRATPGTQAMTAAMTAATSAGMALSSVMTALSAVISLVAIGVSLYIGHQQKLKEKAEEATRTFQESKTTLDEYAERIKTLREEMNSANSEEERYLKAKELKSVQSELVDLYGQQANSLDLINGSLDEEIEKTKRLNRAKALEAVSENEEFTKKALKKYENYNGTIRLGSYEGKGGADRAAELLQKYGAEVDVLRGAGEIKINITSDIAIAKNALAQLYNYANYHQDEFHEDVRRNIKDAYNTATDTYNKYYDQIKNSADEIVASVDFSDPVQKGLVDVYNKYLSDLEGLKNSVSEGRYDIAATMRESAIKNLEIIEQTGGETWAAVARDMKNMLYAYMDTSLKIQLDFTADIKNDKDLQEGINALKNEFGDIDLTKLEHVNPRSKAAKALEYLRDKAEESGYSVQELIDLLNKMNHIEIESAVTEDFTGSLESQLNLLYEMEAGFEKLQKMYNDIKDGGQFDFGQLAQKDFIETFKIEGLKDEYNEFLETITKYPSNLSKCQDAFNKLTTAYLEQSGVLKNLSEENKEVTAAYLKNMGVSNALEVVNSRLSASVTMDEAAYDRLCGVMGDAIDVSKNAEGQYQVEAGALTKLGVSAETAMKIMIVASMDATIKTKEQALKRIASYEAEMKAYQSLMKEADAYDDMMSKNDNPEYWLGSRKDWKNTTITYDEAWEQLRNTGNEYREGAKRSTSQEVVDYYNALEEAKKEIEAIDANYTPPKKSSSSGSSKDEYKAEWERRKTVMEQQLQSDKISKKQYYDWLKKAYKDPEFGIASPNLSAEKKKEYADDVAKIETELYEWEKEQIQDSIDEQDAILKNKRVKGLISEAEYQKELAKVTEDGYKELLRKVQENELYGVDSTERLNAETELLEKIKDAHIAEFESEVSELDHLRSLELITQEQYYAQRSALVAEYYGTEEMYRDELKKEEEELFKERTDLVKKYADVAKKAISSIMDAAKNMTDAVGDLVQGIIDANSSNFDLQKNFLKHQLDMNYITEKEYYARLKDLYQTYYRSKSIYLDEYWENQEEIYQYEMDSMEDGASALEDIHARVVDLIKQELEDAKDAIEETKESYEKLIDLRRKALEEEKDENDTERSRVAKLNEIAELTRQLNALRNDNSAEGQRKYKEILAQLIEAKRDLQEFEEEQAYKAATAQLDREAEALDQRSENATKELDDKLDDNEWLVNEAWMRLRGMNESLYQELMDYTRKHSTSIKDEVTGTWETAKDAFNDYKDDVKSGYEEISRTLLHPEIYNPGITSGEVGEDAITVRDRERENYRKVLQDFAEDIADIMGTSVQSVAEIINKLFPGVATDLMVDGADIFADSLGLVGVGGTIASTIAALGGLAGIVEMMNGFQDLAEGGGEYGGIAIGGENVDLITAILQTIQDNGVGLSLTSGSTADLINIITQAITAGPTSNSSVVSGITSMANILTALLSVGTILIGGGGSGAATLFSLLQATNGLLDIGNNVDGQSSNLMNMVLSGVISLCKYTVDILNSSNVQNGEILKLRDVLYGSWSLIYNLLSKYIDNSGSMSVLGGLVGSLAGNIISGNSGEYTRLVGGIGGITSVLSEAVLKMLSGSQVLTGGTAAKFAEIGASILPALIGGNNNDIVVSPVFNIESTDPEGVASEIQKLFPQITDYVITSLLSSSSNKGIKRNASSLV